MLHSGALQQYRRRCNDSNNKDRARCYYHTTLHLIIITNTEATWCTYIVLLSPQIRGLRDAAAPAATKIAHVAVCTPAPYYHGAAARSRNLDNLAKFCVQIDFSRSSPSDWLNFFASVAGATKKLMVNRVPAYF